MLEALDIHDGDTALEIGTGTGYNAALLSHRLGSRNVTSIEVDPHIAEAARQRLAGLGYHPTVITGDGANGAAQHAPYDRVIATVAAPTVEPAWIDQTRPGGFGMTVTAGGTQTLRLDHPGRTVPPREAAG
jgi:protein-L-isoaspartate(D-aspartate) O-methyltransferase